ncbi:MAG TPA: aminoglycoside phosphotransferase family protein [bacterium]
MVQLRQLNVSLRGPIEQPHIYPWATVLRVSTDRGDLFFKASLPVLAHEPALTEMLARWRPDCTADVLATDRDRGWMLTRDAGAKLRDVIASSGDRSHWMRVLPLYAELQIQMGERLADLLAVGVPDHRLGTLPRRYENLLGDRQALRIGLDEGLSPGEYERLLNHALRFAELCRSLEEFDIPESLQHDDFHSGNIFVQDGRYVFFDWGDSCVAHPFFSMVVTFRVIAHEFGVEAGGPEIVRLRDAYIEPWTRVRSRSTVLEAFAIAQQVGTVCRVLTWHGVISGLEEPFRSEYGEAVPRWLRAFLSAASGQV